LGKKLKASSYDGLAFRILTGNS